MLANFVVALPSAFVFAFAAGLGLNGLWLGMCVGYAVAAIMFTVFLVKTDWVAASERAIKNTAGADSASANHVHVSIDEQEDEPASVVLPLSVVDSSDTMKSDAAPEDMDECEESALVAKAS